MFTATFDARDVQRIVKRLAQVERRASKERQQRLLNAVKRSGIVAEMKAAAPKGATGKLGRAVKARKGRRNESVLIGPVGGKSGAFYRHMVVGGTRPHGIAPKSKRAMRIGDRFARGSIDHPGTRAQPFVGQTVAANRDELAREVMREFYGK